ncbi:putative inclusion body protein [Sweet potato vein clearing virus]|uniref:Putative inclusion body protein n=1 Tax=Sweet potato vein clearing virus TaxID=995049 RepID=F2XXZ5_9VIRU|nr:putative inclusion body protein [Sweet potato vein clearing virus]ADZ45066.1 putative inclusion body protein [Sweet potato vein clearing virus]
MLNQKPIQDPNLAKEYMGYITQPNKNYNKLIALPKTSASLVRSCYLYGMLATVYTSDGSELVDIPEICKAVKSYLAVTKAKLLYVRFYSTPAEITMEDIKPVITVVKIGMTKEMIIPEGIKIQPQIAVEEIADFFANKRVIQLKNVVDELANNYTSNNPIWIYHNRENTLIYSLAKEVKPKDMEDIRLWIMTLINPEKNPLTRAIKKEFISDKIKGHYCKIISEYPDHLCTRCGGRTNEVPDIDIHISSPEPSEAATPSDDEDDELLPEGHDA